MKTNPLGVRMDPEEKAALERAVASEDRSMSALARRVVVTVEKLLQETQAELAKARKRVAVLVAERARIEDENERLRARVVELEGMLEICKRQRREYMPGGAYDR